MPASAITARSPSATRFGHAYSRGAVFWNGSVTCGFAPGSVGHPRLLDDAEIERVAEKLATYGPLHRVTDARPDPA